MPPFPSQPHLPPSPISFFFTSQILSSPTVAPLPLRCSQVVRWRWRSSEDCLALLSSVFVPSDFCTPTYTPTNQPSPNCRTFFFLSQQWHFLIGLKRRGRSLLRVTFLDFLRLIIPHWAQLRHRGGWNKVHWWRLAGSLLILVNLPLSFILFCYSLCLFLWPFYSHFTESLCALISMNLFFSLPLSIFSPSSAASSKTQTTFDKNVRMTTFLQNICHTNFIFIRSTENSLRVPCLETVCPSISRNPRIVWPNLREAAVMLAFQIPAKVSHNYNCVHQSGLDSGSSSCSVLLVLRKCINLWKPILYVNFHFGKPNCTQPASNGMLDIDLHLHLPFK